MELTYPIAVYIGIALVCIIFVFTLWNKKKYKGGKRAANTEFVRTLPAFKWMMIEYHFLRVLVVTSLIVSILFSVYLTGKPIEVKTMAKEVHNRDIMICFDVSTSLDDVSCELCDKLIDFVGELHGERFGVTIFNCAPVQIVPLTDDYDFVISQLERLKNSIEDYYSFDYSGGYDGEWRFAGTITNVGGSSLIGDGLTGALYNFPDLDDNPERARMIVFVTDNDLLGTPIVTVPKACELCEAHDVKVFALSPDFIVDESTFRQSIESTGGAYFNTRDSHAMDDMLEKVQDTDVSASYTKVTTVNDVPDEGIIALIVGVAIYCVCARRLRL